MNEEEADGKRVTGGLAPQTPPLSRLDAVAAWVVHQMAYLLTAVGAFVLGISVGLWLAYGMPARQPVSGVAGVTSQRIASPPSQPGARAADSVVEGNSAEGSDADPADLIGEPARSESSSERDRAPAADASIANLTVQAPQGFSAATLRASPSSGAQSLAVLGNGTRLEQLAGSATAEDYEWVRVRAPDGVVGWVVALATQPQPIRELSP